MWRSSIAFVAEAVLALLAVLPTTAAAQQVYATVPQVTVSDSFWEQIGIDWGFRRQGPNGYLFFDRGGFGAPPAFGGYDPQSLARFGFGGRTGNGSFYFQLQAGQGSQRSAVANVPSVMIPNGGVGFIQDSTMRPFVTGLVPVVGGYVSPLQDRIARWEAERRRQASLGANGSAADSETPTEPRSASFEPTSPHGDAASAKVVRSTAEAGDVSVAELKQQAEQRQQAEHQAQQAKLRELFASAQAAEAAGNFGAARVRYQQVMRRADGELREQAGRRYDAIRQK